MPGKTQTAARKIRVMLVDDEPLVCNGLGMLLEVEPDLVVCGEAESEPQAIERIPALRPDVAVVDLVLKEGTSLNLIKQLRQRCPKMKILVFSLYDQAHCVAGAFAAGAHGYVTKDEGTEKLVKAIHVVMSGKFYLNKEMAARRPSVLPGSAHRDIGRHG